MCVDESERQDPPRKGRGVEEKNHRAEKERSREEKLRLVDGGRVWWMKQ